MTALHAFGALGDAGFVGKIFFGLSWSTMLLAIFDQRVTTETSRMALELESLRSENRRLVSQLSQALPSAEDAYDALPVASPAQYAEGSANAAARRLEAPRRAEDTTLVEANRSSNALRLRGPDADGQLGDSEVADALARQDELVRRLGTQFFMVGTLGSLSSCVAVTAGVSYDLNAASCSGGSRCPMCFVATSLSADVDLELVRCSTLKVSPSSSLSSTQMGEFIFVNQDSNNMLTIKSASSASSAGGTAKSTYYLPPLSSVGGVCYGGGADTMVFPSAHVGVGTGTVNTYTFNGKTISDLGTVTTADIDGGSVDGVTIGAGTAAAGTFTDLNVNGNLEIGDAATDYLKVTSEIRNFAGNLVFSLEGASVNGFETHIAVDDPGSEITVTIPAETGTILTSATTAANSLQSASSLATVGTLASGSIAAGFGTITTNNAVTSGALTANGHVTLGDAATDTLTINAVLQGTNVMSFEGNTANDHEITLAVADPGADHTVTIPAETGSFLTTASLNANTLASASSLATVGALTSGSIASGFGTIQTANAITTTAAVTSGDLTVNGNTVVGSDDSDTVTMNAVINNFNGNKILVLEGSTANAHEIFIEVADPAADHTITIPAETGSFLTTASLNANTLASASSLATVGTVTSGSIATGFGSIQTANSITGGALTANGNVVLGDAEADKVTISGQLQGAHPLIFDGATDDTRDIYLAIEDPTTGDATVTLPAETGTLLTSSTTAANSLQSASSLATVGALASGSISTGFGNIQTGGSVTCAALTASGNVQLGDSATGDSLEMNAAIVNFNGNRALLFEGATAADSKYTNIEIVDPTGGSVTVTIPAETGTIVTTVSTAAGGLQTAGNLVTVGALASGSIASGFGSIQTTNAITTTAAVTSGDLTANGNVIIGDAASDTITLNGEILNFNGNKALTFEGATTNDNKEITIEVADPTGGDQTITIPAETGTFLTSASTNAAALATAANLVTTGALASGSIATGFGAIQTANAITGTDITANGNTVIGSDNADHVTVNAEVRNYNGNKLFILEGATADANEISLEVADPGTDVTVTIPAETGTLLTSATTAANTLASATSLASVGTLTTGAIGSGFGNIQFGSAITTTGAVTSGDFQANGNTVLGDSGLADTIKFQGEIFNFNGDKAMIFEGATTNDDKEIFIEIDDPTAGDQTITIPAETGTFLTSATTAANSLASASSLVTVGALASGSIASGFGSITTTDAVTCQHLTTNGDTVIGSDTADTIRLNGEIINFNGNKALIFRGATTSDNKEITIEVADPTGGDQTITIPAETGTFLTSASTNAAALATAANLVTTGALATGSIASGFGSITTTNAITGGDVTANGNVVLGSNNADTVTVNAVIQNQNAFTFEGNTDDANELTLAVADPASDITVTIPAETGTILTSVSTAANALQSATSLVTVGALATGSIASGFGTIQTANAITTSAKVTAGDLQSDGNVVLGSDDADTLTVNAVIQGTNALTFEGNTANFHEITLAVADPTADRTVTIPAETGTIITSASTNAASLATAANLVTTGALASGSIASGFGSIQTANSITGGDITADGNVVLGSNTADTVTVNGEIRNYAGNKALAFEGATTNDGYETTIEVVDPTGGDRTITIPSETGTIITSASTNAAALATAANLVTVGALATGSIASGFGTITTTNQITSGDLSSNGNTVLGDAATDTLTVNAVIQSTNALTFEGNSADDHELTLAVADPSADLTVTIPAETGTILTSASTNAAALAAAANLVTVGALASGSIATGFGSIQTANSVTSGDLTANGNTVIGNAVTDTLTLTSVILGSTGMHFEGNTVNDAETFLLVEDPTADRTVTIPQETGTLLTSATANANSLSSASSLATVGALSGGSIASGFGTISTGNGITTTATMTSEDLTINGDSILGSNAADTVTVNGVLQGQYPLLFESGTADDNELALAIAVPSGDVTVTIPAETGTIITSASTTAAGLTTAGNLATVGALASGSIASGFGSIVTGNDITTTAHLTSLHLTVDDDTVLGQNTADTIAMNGVITGTNALVFEGNTANDHEIALAVADPGADATVTIPAETGTLLTTVSTASALTSTGALASGTIATGFGAISTQNIIQTTASLRAGGGGSGGVYVNGIKVVGEQVAAIASLGSSGASTVAQLEAVCNAILVALRNHGLINT